MRQLVGVFILFIFLGCSKGMFYDEAYYERISGMHIPASAEIIESYDNGEFVTGTTFSINQTDLQAFIKRYVFKPKGNAFAPPFLGNSYLRLEKPVYGHKQGQDLYIHFGTKGKNSWLYIVDLKSNRLWTEIQYPDMAGD